MPLVDAQARQQVRRRSTTVFERFDSETLVLDLDSGRSVRLNGTGSRLWEALDEPRAPSELAAILTEEWELSAERATSDVAAFIEALRERELIELETR